MADRRLPPSRHSPRSRSSQPTELRRQFVFASVGVGRRDRVVVLHRATGVERTRSPQSGTVGWALDGLRFECDRRPAARRSARTRTIAPQRHLIDRRLRPATGVGWRIRAHRPPRCPRSSSPKSRVGRSTTAPAGCVSRATASTRSVPPATRAMLPPLPPCARPTPRSCTTGRAGSFARARHRRATRASVTCWPGCSRSPTTRSPAAATRSSATTRSP